MEVVGNSLKTRSWLYPLTALLCSLYGLFLRFMKLYQRDFWTDEAHQFNCIQGPFKHFWLNVVPKGYGDHTYFPGEYILTYPLVSAFGMNKWILAIPHILITILGFYFLYRVCQRFELSLVALLTVFVMVVVNKNLVFHAFEFRPYAVLPTLALGSLYFSDIFFKEFDRLSDVKKIGMIVFFSFTALYHAYGVLIFGLPIVLSFLTYHKSFMKQCNNKKSWMYVMALLVIPSLIWLWYASSNTFGLNANTKVQSVTQTWQFIPSPIQNPVGFAKGIIGNLIGYRKLYVVLIPILAALIIPFSQWKRRWLFLIVLVVLPLSLIMMVDIKSQYWFIQRQFVWVMVYFAIFSGLSVDSIAKFVNNRLRAKGES